MSSQAEKRAGIEAGVNHDPEIRDVLRSEARMEKIVGTSKGSTLTQPTNGQPAKGRNINGLTINTNNAQCLSTGLEAKSKEEASPSEIGPAMSPVLSVPKNDNKSVDGIPGNTSATVVGSNPGVRSRRRTLASIIMRPGVPSAEVTDDMHATDALHARLPDILTHAAHSEMFGVPLQPLIVGMELDIPTRIVLNKFLRANDNDVDAADQQLRAALS
jgi:hypothetical protein